MSLETHLSDGTTLCEIRVRGQLDEKRRVWFEGMTVKPLTGDETSICGMMADQAALFGILGKVRDMGLVLLSVRRMEG